MALTLAAGRGRHRAPAGLVVAALVVTAAVLLPPAYLVGRAAGSDSIWETLTESRVIDAIARTVILTVTVTAGCIALAVPLAWLTGRTDLPLRRFWTVLLALPLAIPSFVGSFVMVSALGPRGLLQDLLEPLGVERLPSIYGFPGAWIVLTLFTYPYIFLQVRALLGRIDPAMEEASRSLGKTAWQTFWRVNLPQMRPSTAAGALLVALYVLSEFGAVSMLRYDTLTPLVYIQYTTSFDRASAAVLGLPLILLAVLILSCEGLTRGRARYHARGQLRTPATLKLGRWRWPAFGLCLVIAGMGFGIPVAVILYWLIDGVRSEVTTSFLVESATNSARAAGLAAVVTAIGCVPIAYLSARHPAWTTGLMEKASYAGQSLPAITIALAMVFFAANYLNSLYQTIWVLVFAYAIRFLPEAMGATRASLLQVNPNTEEAARSLGAGPVRTAVRITAPQTFSGVSVGMLLVFLTAMKELPITILLSPAGFDTLTTQIWAATSEAFFTKAALPSLVLILISAAAVFLMIRRERLT